MSSEETTPSPTGTGQKFQFLAALISLIGLADSIYLTIHHLAAEPVPCSIVSGCETVLTSAYAEIAGVPLAGFGALGYFAAFALSVLAAFGNSRAWSLFGGLAVIMVLVTCWLLYLQAFVIGAFCQFCLLSAGTSFALLIVFLITKLRSR